MIRLKKVRCHVFPIEPVNSHAWNLHSFLLASSERDSRATATLSLRQSSTAREPPEQINQQNARREIYSNQRHHRENLLSLSRSGFDAGRNKQCIHSPSSSSVIERPNESSNSSPFERKEGCGRTGRSDRQETSLHDLCFLRRRHSGSFARLPRAKIHQKASHQWDTRNSA